VTFIPCSTSVISKKKIDDTPSGLTSRKQDLAEERELWRIRAGKKSSVRDEAFEKDKWARNASYALSTTESQSRSVQ
jgi:hypothetical protein